MDKDLPGLQAIAVQRQAGETARVAPARRKTWHAPRLTVLDVSETKKGGAPGVDASDSFSTAS